VLFQKHPDDVIRTLDLSETSRVVSCGAEKNPDARIWGEVIAAGEIPWNVRSGRNGVRNPQISPKRTSNHQYLHFLHTARRFFSKDLHRPQ
jgi:hypothetical protein